MKRIAKLCVASSILTSILVSGSLTNAQVVTYTSRALWEAAIGGAGNVSFMEDFEGFVSDTEFRTVTVDVNGNFTLRQVGSNTFRNLIETPPFQFSDNNGTKHASMFTDFGATTVCMEFTPAIYAWGADFSIGVPNEDEDLEVIIEMATVLATINVTDGFFGFVASSAGETIVKLTFKSRNNLNGGEGFGLDNVTGVASQGVPVQTATFGRIKALYAE